MADDEVLNPTDNELTDDAVKQFYEAFYKSFNEEKSPVGDFLFNELENGNQTIYNKSIRETKVFDNSFVDVLKSAFPSLMKITKEPKRQLKYEQEVLAMEKAKKINSDSIRFLASHTQYIKSYDDGNVIPSKILTTYSEDDLGLYENKFIKTLINRVIKFLDRRILLFEQNLESYQSDEVRYSNKINLNNASVDYNISVRITNQLQEETSVAKKLFKDVKSLKEGYESLKFSKLYMAVAKEKDIVPPIMKTNIILHNADFKVAYNLWLYLEKNSTIGYDVESKERNHTDNKIILQDINRIGAYAIGSILNHRGTNGYQFDNSNLYKKNNRKVIDVDKETKEYQLTPSNVALEHQEVSEFFLDKTKEYFNDVLDDANTQGLSKEMSVKKVYREMLNTINSIYKNLFDFNIYDDLAKTNVEKYEEIKRQLKIMKLVYEQKQIDLNKLDREIARNEKLLKTLETKAKAEEKRRKLKEQRENMRKKLQEQREALREKKRQEMLKKKEEGPKPSSKKTTTRKTSIKKKVEIKEDVTLEDKNVVDTVTENVNVANIEAVNDTPTPTVKKVVKKRSSSKKETKSSDVKTTKKRTSSKSLDKADSKDNNEEFFKRATSVKLVPKNQRKPRVARKIIPIQFQEKKKEDN